MFAKLFKPRWQHSKAAVRIKAVGRLSADNAEHIAVLSQLARQDQSIEVRQAAVQRLPTPALLSEILEQDSNPAIRRSAAQRICKIILDENYTDSDRLNCLNHLHDDNILAHIALHSSDPEIQRQAIININDQHCLATLTAKGASTQLRQQAAQRLELPELLAQVSRTIKGKDKSVFRIIRNKQQQLQQQARDTEQQRLRQTALLDSLQQLASTDFFPQYAAKFEALQQQLADNLLPELQQRFDELQQQCQATLSNVQQQARLAQQQEQQQEQQLSEQQRIQKQLHEQMQCAAERCAALFASEHFNPLDFDAEQQHWQTLLADWQALPVNLQKAVRPLIEQQTMLLEAAQRWFRHQPEIAPLLTKTTLADEHSCQALLQQVRQLQQGINWPTSHTPPQELTGLNQAVLHLQALNAALHNQVQHDSDSLAQQLKALEGALRAGETRQASRLEQQAATMLQGMNGSTPAALQQQYRTLHAQLQEMLDWQGYAMVPKKEQLCEAMEALAETTTDPAELASRIKQLQKQWKKLDASDPYHSHALWQRFKTASDRAYEPCEAYFAAQKKQRETNLAQRKQLVAELSLQLESIDWSNADWPQIEQQSRHTKQQWKLYAPVDRTPGKEVQGQFNALLKQLDVRIKKHREQVAERKRAILADTQALQQSAEKLDAEALQKAAERTKQLQQEWKQAGNTFHAVERTLWPEFREACNQIFTALNQKKQTQRHQHQREQQALDDLLNSDSYAHLLRRIHLCDQMESMLMEGTLDQLALDDFQAAWQQDEPPTPPFDSLIEYRYQQLLDLIAGRVEMEQLTRVTDRALRHLCIRLEIISGVESPEQDQALRMEYQMQRLQSALQQHNQTATLLDMKQLELEWLCQPFAQHHEALQLRFYSKLQL